MPTPIDSVEAYIAPWPADIRERLEQVRQTIKTAAPKAEELISYGLPSYKYHGPLVYFGAFKNHLGFYAVPSGHAAFAKELSAYKGAKGSVQFPYKDPLPLDLIKRIVEFRVQENEQKAAKK